MDTGDTYSITRRGRRYEISTYPAWSNDWAEGRVEVNGRLPGSSPRYGTPGQYRHRHRRRSCSRS